MSRTPGTADQQAEAERWYAALREADLRALAELRATTDDRTIFGATEFAVRDRVLHLGATASATAAWSHRSASTKLTRRGDTRCRAAAARTTRRTRLYASPNNSTSFRTPSGVRP